MPDFEVERFEFVSATPDTVLLRISGGKIAELWITWDNLAVLTQLGHWPPAQEGAPA